MPPMARQRFTRVSDWSDFLTKLQKEGNPEVNLYQLRQNCYTEIEKLRKCPLLVYAVKFPLPPLPQPVPVPISIDLEDVDGFIDLADSVAAETHKVDVILHSPGGSPEATERIVSILRPRFEYISFLIPHSAYSAATMLAFSGDEIILQSNACLGPIDPQINGIPARALKRGFENAKRALKDEGPESLPAYVPLLEKHTLEELEICEDYDVLSKELATEWLSTYMYKCDASKKGIIEEAVKFFSDYDTHRTHGRPLTYGKLKHLNLNIQLDDSELSPLLREAHILLSGFFNITPFIKVFENNQGLSWGKQFQTIIKKNPPPANLHDKPAKT